ncbi:MAG: hypothetical protein Q7R95_11245 [bacterium]|nr:hypothetical protein [bacterium]
MVKKLKRLATSIAWAHYEYPRTFHTDFFDGDITIYHSKSKEFSFTINLNDGKSIDSACNIIQCWCNGIFKPVEELKYGC